MSNQRTNTARRIVRILSTLESELDHIKWCAKTVRILSIVAMSGLVASLWWDLPTAPIAAVGILMAVSLLADSVLRTIETVREESQGEESDV